MTTSTQCPYCNAVLPPLSAPARDSLPCPRCGEAVPPDRWRVDAAAHAVSDRAPPAATAPVPGRRATATAVLAVMFTMAIIGLSYMLWTVQVRRARDPKALLDPVTFRRPLDLQGFGFLPKDSDIIIGLQLAEWLKDEKAAALLLEASRPAPLDWAITQVTRTSGMELPDLDHILIAATLDADFPQLTMVVRTRRPIALTKIADAQPAKSVLHQDEPLYSFPLHPAGEALVWCVNDKTAIYVVRLDEPKIEQLNALSKTPRPVEEAIAAPLRNALKERIAKHQVAWAVGRLDRLGVLKQALPFLVGGKVDASAFKGLKTFALGLEPIEGLTLTGHFEADDAKAARRFAKYLEGFKIEGAKAQVAAPPAEADEQWLTWQVRGEVAALRAWLNANKQRKQ